MVLTFQKKINYYHFDFLISRRVFGPQTKFTMGFPYCNFGDISKKKLFIKIIYQFGDGGPDHAALSHIYLTLNHIIIKLFKEPKSGHTALLILLVAEEEEEHHQIFKPITLFSEIMR